MTEPELQSIDTAVGQNIRTARKGANLTQVALALACGCSFQQVQKYETGKNRVSASRLVAISRALGVPVASLFEGGIVNG